MASISKRTSGAWQNTSYGIRTVATDTITTLPTTIYGDGTNATVSIKGNTVQNGTPTPDNPVMPQGCGELETVGAKAGQYKIPISSADTTTNNYLGEVETTRKILKLVLTGQEYYVESTYWKGAETSAYYTEATGIDLADKNNIVTISSHFKGVARNTASYNDIPCVASSNRYAIFRIETATASTAAEFKQWLAQQYAAGTPVTVWYVLATETTGIVNEPLMRIGDYADEVSGVSIPTTDGANTLSVDTTVQPSEVSINYHGWHMGAVHEYNSGQWD